MIHLLRKKATAAEVAAMLQTLVSYIKLAVDIEQEVAAGGGALHADEALINIRPSQDNPSMTILDSEIRVRVKKVVESLLGSV